MISPEHTNGLIMRKGKMGIDKINIALAHPLWDVCHYSLSKLVLKLSFKKMKNTNEGPDKSNVVLSNAI